jgi:hypothetical protein
MRRQHFAKVPARQFFVVDNYGPHIGLFYFRKSGQAKACPTKQSTPAASATGISAAPKPVKQTFFSPPTIDSLRGLRAVLARRAFGL